MTFAQRLLKKIQVDSLARAVRTTIKPPGMGGEVDKDSMRELLAMLDFEKTSARDMEFQVKNADSPDSLIMVMDNELALYKGTNVEDVAMRKNPIVKEMVKIRNIRKILSDKDVVISRRQDSVDAIQEMIMGDVDLSFTKEDILEIRDTSLRALTDLDLEGIENGVVMFAELLGYVDHPFARRKASIVAKGILDKTKADTSMFGPSAILVKTNARLLWLEAPMDVSKKENREFFDTIVRGDRNPDVSGGEVFAILASKVLDQYLLQQGGRADLKNRES